MGSGPVAPVAAHGNLPPAVAVTKVYDYSGSSLIYEGWAYSLDTQGGDAPTTAGASWAITKYTYTAGLVTKQEWADGNTDFDNIWDNRAALTYK